MLVIYLLWKNYSDTYGMNLWIDFINLVMYHLTFIG